MKAGERGISMQIPKTLVPLTSLIPSSRKLMTLARKTRFVLRK